MEVTWEKIQRTRLHRQSQQYDELSQLEMQFRNAYVMKTLDVQLAEKQADRMARETEEKLSRQIIAREYDEFIEKNSRRSLEVSRTRFAYKNALEKQIAEKIQVKRQEELVAAEERKILAEVDELTDKLHDLMKQKRRDYNTERSRRERLLFEKMREIKRMIKEMEGARATEREVLYLKEIERRSCEATKLRAEQVKRREDLIDRVARLFVDTTLEKCERETVIGDLVAEDIRHEAMIEESERVKMLKVKKKELATDLMDQMLLTAECEARARERDQIFAKNIMKKLMELDTKFTRLTVEAKKRRQQQYKEDLEKLILQRKRMREEALQQAQREFNENCRAMDEAERLRIKVERRRLIEEHAGNVAEYLKIGILSKEEEDIVKELLQKCKQSFMMH